MGVTSLLTGYIHGDRYFVFIRLNLTMFSRSCCTVIMFTIFPGSDSLAILNSVRVDTNESYLESHFDIIIQFDVQYSCRNDAITKQAATCPNGGNYAMLK